MLYVRKRRANIFSVGRKIVKLLCLVMLVFGKYTGWFNSMRLWWGQACRPWIADSPVSLWTADRACRTATGRQGLSAHQRLTGRSRLPCQPNRLLSCRYGTCRPSRGRHGSYQHGLLCEARTWLLGPVMAPWPPSTAPRCSRAKSTDHHCGRGKKSELEREEA